MKRKTKRELELENSELRGQVKALEIMLDAFKSTVPRIVDPAVPDVIAPPLAPPPYPIFWPSPIIGTWPPRPGFDIICSGSR